MNIARSSYGSKIILNAEDIKEGVYLCKVFVFIFAVGRVGETKFDSQNLSIVSVPPA